MKLKIFILQKWDHIRAGNYTIAENLKEESICTIKAEDFREAAASIGAKLTSNDEYRYIEFCYAKVLKNKHWKQVKSDDPAKIKFVMQNGKLAILFDAKTKKPADDYTSSFAMDTIYHSISYHLQCLPAA